MAVADQHTSGEISQSHPRPTLADVARAAGVSASTASIAFSGSGPVSDATKAKVLAAAQELGYGGPDPRARSLRQGRSGVVGVVLDSRLLYAFRDPLTSVTLDGISTAFGGRGIGLLLLTAEAERQRGGVSELDGASGLGSADGSDGGALADAGSGDAAGAGGAVGRGPGQDSDSDEGTVAATIENAAVDAVILLGCGTDLSSSVEVLSRREIPVVAIEGPALEGAYGVALNNRDASRAAAEHIRSLGHSRVGIVALAADSERHPGLIDATTAMPGSVTSDRLLGTHDIFADAPAYASAYNTPEDGRLAALALLDVPEQSRPTAIIAQADLLALGVIEAAEELGLRVPDDLSVIGFDGIRTDGAPFELTTMVQPSADKGFAAGRAVLELLAGRTPAPSSFTCTLRVGTTTAPPRA